MPEVNEGLAPNEVDDGVDEFADAFAVAVAAEDGTTPTEKVVDKEPVVELTDEQKAEQQAEADRAEAEAEAEKKKKDEEEAAAKKAAEEAAANTPAAIAAATAKALVDAQTAASDAATKKKKDEEEVAAKLAEEEAANKLSPEEIEELNGLHKEWGDIARMFELEFKQNSGLAATAQGKAMQRMLDHIYGDIQPIAASTKEVQEQLHFDSITTAHPDFDDINPKIKPWIDTQPAYLQKALDQVYTGGTAEEVIDLVQRFKDAEGIVTPKADDSTSSDTTPTTPAAKPVVKPDAASVAALTPVDSQRSQVQQKGVDQNDYGAGWDEAIALAAKNSK